MSHPKKANKVVIIGDSSVGKTCIIERLLTDSFAESKPTIGACHHSKTINGCSLDIWDTAGQERFKSMIPMYYKGAKCIIVVFDLTDQSSFEGAKNWLGEIEANTKNTIIILCGNKCDLDDKRTISLDSFNQFANGRKLKFFETSAKENINITELFNTIAEEIINQPQPDNKVSGNVNIADKNNNDASTCGYC